MDQYQAVEIHHLTRMYTKRTKHQAEDDWSNEYVNRASRRLAKEAEKLRRQDDARGFQENPLERSLREQQAFERYLRDVREAEAFRTEQETRLTAKRLEEFRRKEEARCLREDALERYFRAEKAFAVEQETGKGKGTRALKQLQQDVIISRAQEVGGPLQRKRSRRPKPSRSYYWPQEAPSAWDENPPVPVTEQPIARARAPQLNVPSLILTASDPESEPSTHKSRRVIDDTSMLSPAYPRRTPSPNLRTPSNSKSRKSRKKISGHQRLAPKPSLFSYNTCDHPQCPLRGYAHEKGVFLYPEKYATDEEYASAAKTFGNGNPTPGVWDAYFNAMADLRASHGDTGAVSREDIEVVRGFVAAHPMS